MGLPTLVHAVLFTPIWIGFRIASSVFDAQRLDRSRRVVLLLPRAFAFHLLGFLRPSSLDVMAPFLIITFLATFYLRFVFVPVTFEVAKPISSVSEQSNETGRDRTQVEEPKQDSRRSTHA
jgi:hypothetical protein